MCDFKYENCHGFKPVKFKRIETYDLFEGDRLNLNLSEDKFFSIMQEIYLEAKRNKFPLRFDILKSKSATKDLLKCVKLNINLSEDEFLSKMQEFYLEAKANIDKYPTTFKECCEIMQCNLNQLNGRYKEIEIVKILKLFIIRDAYWLVANWLPNWDKKEIRYTIIKGEVVPTTDKHFLVFPTNEIAMKFMNCFGDELDDCNEFIYNEIINKKKIII